MSTNSLSLPLTQEPSSHFDTLIRAVQAARHTLEEVEYGINHPDYSSIRIHYYWEPK